MKGTGMFQRACYKSGKYLKNHSPTILSIISAIGVIGTAVLAVKATPKAIERLEQAKKEKGENLTKFEVAVVAGPVYIPTTLIGVSTIVCVLGANALNKRQQASLISAYALLEESYKEYRNAAKKVYGDDADEKIIAEMANNTYISCDGWHLYDPDHDKDSDRVLFYDFYSQRFFNAPMGQVINAEYHINRNLQLRGDVTVNEFYDFLGLEQIPGGDNIGWILDDLMAGGLMWLDFDNRFTTMEGGMECHIISPAWTPELMYPDE